MQSTPITQLTQLAPVAAMHTAEVLAQQEQAWLVGASWGQLRVACAASCLLQPAVGDQVLIGGELPDKMFVLAVLHRPTPAPFCHRLGEGVDLRVESPGKLSVQATQQVQLHSDEVSLIGRSGRLLLGKLQAVSRDMSFSFGAARVVGDTVETTLSRLSQWLGHSRRNVKGLDQTRSGDIDCRADQTLVLHGKQLLASADKLARLDGDQVHIG